ncbi:MULTISPECIES: hypothetical protein [Paraburkholderia]|uniref:Uncharacterized protein n=1 Tax=Paraburkholderia madseniana TaxID=2599607 RepID=A0AAP5F0V9_9BURK|nr:MULTISPECIES: hypothetical protein [Paraburkholderia]MCX4151008.1 hypothetical protein [Paraburkholderia madseniana]MCX4176648.1 hypothetical protein [Paraburkholderia madseniana]MDN7153940.1 hypothetical protein [Paraburkholderia sp. WS6]MDQ6412822.1 hypothetical protein [Paraburkholderia madseniana]MDQ6464639.1 hypothetical protein [Paraburkholderia madseniana]
MFLPIDIESVNAPDQLPPGEYDATCLVWSSPNGHDRMMEFRYTRVGKEHHQACDLLFIDSAGNVRLCDFIRMPDDAWRDSFGARADQLVSLLPDDVSTYRLVDEQDLGCLYLQEGA